MLYIWNRLVFDFVNVHAPIIWKRIKSSQSRGSLEATKNREDVKKVLDRWIIKRDTYSWAKTKVVYLLNEAKSPSTESEP